MNDEELYSALGRPGASPQERQIRAENLILNELSKPGPIDPWRANLICYFAQSVLVRIVERIEKKPTEGKLRKKRGPHSMTTRMRISAGKRLRDAAKNPTILPPDTFDRLRALDAPKPRPAEDFAEDRSKENLEAALASLRARKDELPKESA